MSENQTKESTELPVDIEKTEVLGPRIGAQIIDFVAIFAILIGVSFIGGLLGALAPTEVSGVSGIFILLAVFAAFFYTFLLEGYWDGQTLGKYVMSIQVVKSDGTQCNYKKSFIRNLPAILIPGWLIYLVAVFSIYSTEYNQRIFDRVAGTLVVAKSDD